MNLKELESEIEQAERALFETTNPTDWDKAVHRYNELKIKWFQYTGESITLETVNIAEYNNHKLNTL
ncbi:hypothetical protein [Dysgonomonas sp. ZJ279]|uniref:hypothetical protein n=1 Tax=Dysgonomonas sp. ZJ279 TaxID=2709796 RepID=UPI0013EB9DEB|nr:hypothetical protein [Dysgonomonas sp. ZJ279]